jgi:UDP-glucuronate 4-epimerase
MRYIVTGAAGFIGFHLTDRLLRRDHHILGIDSINDYYDVSLKKNRLKELGIDPEDLPRGEKTGSLRYPRFRFALLTIEDRENLDKLCEDFYREHGGIDGIIHLAAQAGVRYGVENPRAYINANIIGFFNIIEVCRNLRIPHLVYASSSSVYGLNENRPFSPHHAADHPVSLYAATKRSNELFAHTYSHLFGIPSTGVRFFTVYGPWGRPDMAYYKFSRAIMEGRPIEVYHNGEMSRDFTYIDDIVEGMLLILDHPPKGAPGFDPAHPDPSISRAPYKIYNLGNNRPEGLGFFIETLEKALGKRAVKKFLPAPRGDVLATEADIDDARNELNWRPHTNISDGLNRFAGWFRGYYPNYFL